MWRSKKLTEAQTQSIELQQIGYVIGKTDHGALSHVDEFGLSYDNAPEWLAHELDDGTYLTVVTYGGGYGSEAEGEIVDANGATWKLIGTYAHSGESECPVDESSGEKVTRDQCVLVPDPFRHSEHYRSGCDGILRRTPNAVRAECPMCEARIGEAHGYLYIGEGFEAVYKLEETEDTE